jgi:hypothetical protein
MSVVLPKSRFLHLPKTGGVWVEWTIRKCVKNIVVINNPELHTHIETTPHPERFTFSFVRHPITWYQSYWAYKMGVGWTNAFDSHCGTNDFAQFVRNAVEKHPGHYAWVCRLFLGPPGEEIDFIGRTENLSDDLRTVLTQAGDAFNSRAGGRNNVSKPEWKAKAVVTDEVRDLIAASESEVFERFDYNPESY